jgi:hypothetical protein
MNTLLWIKLINEGIPLLICAGIGLVTYRGIKKNQHLIAEREDLVRRYLLFRGDKQVRLKAYGQEDPIQKELLKTLSSSWKNFKRSYDQYQNSFLANTAATRNLLLLLTFGLLINTARRLIEEAYFYGFEDRFILAAARELIHYVLVAISFFLLKVQARLYVSPNAQATRMDLETLFFPNAIMNEQEQQQRYNEFEPLEDKGV